MRSCTEPGSTAETHSGNPPGIRYLILLQVKQQAERRTQATAADTTRER